MIVELSINQKKDQAPIKVLDKRFWSEDNQETRTNSNIERDPRKI